jgi:hypothetical protein
MSLRNVSGERVIETSNSGLEDRSYEIENTPSRCAEKRSQTMLGTIVTLVLVLVLVLFPLLIPTTVTAIHALAQLRGSRTHAHALN